MMELLQEIISLINGIISTISQTAENIDSINFDTMLFADYLGYARYVMGDGVYIMFTTVVLIGIGVTVWTYLLKGISYIKELLPW